MFTCLGHSGLSVLVLHRSFSDSFFRGEHSLSSHSFGAPLAKAQYLRKNKYHLL